MRKKDEVALLERLDRLERELADLRSRLDGAGPLPATPVADLVTSSIQLVDAEGRLRAALRTQPGGHPELVFCDPEGQPRVSLALEGPGLPVQRFHDPHGITRLRLDIDENNHPSLLLCDERANGVLRLYVDGELPCLVLADPVGGIRAQVGLEAGYLPTVILEDSAGRTRLQLFVGPDDRPSAMVFGTEGQVLARLAAPAQPTE